MNADELIKEWKIAEKRTGYERVEIRAKAKGYAEGLEQELWFFEHNFVYEACLIFQTEEWDRVKSELKKLKEAELIE